VTPFFAPEPLGEGHLLDEFESGVASLDDWLVRRARANADVGASQTFVVTDDAGAVVAYYALSMGSILRAAVPRAARQGAPHPVPVLLIGRFAVARRAQGQGVGRSLLQDALARCARLADEVGFMFVLVHPVDDSADAFWRRFGFVSAPTDEPMLLLSLAQVRAVLGR
jgi:GNAT superfamily N-acetyltransferase